METPPLKCHKLIKRRDDLNYKHKREVPFRRRALRWKLKTNKP